MKRFFLPVLALLLVLCGCAAQPEPTTIPTETTATEPAPTEEPVLYTFLKKSFVPFLKSFPAT